MSKTRMNLILAVFLISVLSIAAQRGKDTEFHANSMCKEGLDCSELPVARSAGGIVYNTGDAIVQLNPATGKPLWIYSPAKGRISSNIVTLDNLLFFTGNTAGPCGPIYALDGSTRKVVWSMSYSSCKLWTDGRLLYLQGDSGDGVRALIPTNGKQEWSAEDETPTFVQALVTQSSRIYTDDRILNERTGQTILWLSKHSYLPSFLPAGDILFTGTRDGSLNALDISNASERWHSQRLKGWEVNAILTSDGLVFATAYEGNATSSRNGILRAFRLDNGQLRWSYPLHSCCQNLPPSPIAEAGGKLFLLTPKDAKSGTTLIALDGQTGKPLWSHESETTLNGPPAVEGEHIYLTDSKGGLIALDSATGRSLWKYEP